MEDSKVGYASRKRLRMRLESELRNCLRAPIFMLEI